MKKILLFSCLVLLSFLTSGSVFAADKEKPSETEVIVTEQIPGMKCTLVTGVKDTVTERKYRCTIKSGFGSIMDIFKGLIKYATFITALVGVLMLVVSGIQYSISGADKDAAGHAKTRIVKVLSGIVLLFLIGFILNSVAPWVYR